MAQQRTTPAKKGLPLWQHIAIYLILMLLMAGIVVSTGWADDKPPMAIAIFFGTIVVLGLYYLVTHYKPDGFIDFK
jgi:L-asparagine transporter-like permease